MSNPLNPPEYCSECGHYHGPLDACPALDADLCADCEANLAEYGSDICRACAKERAAESRFEWERDEEASL